MKDWVVSLNEFLTFRKRNILHGSGKVSNADMERRALAEYVKFNTRRLKTPTEMSEDEISDVDELNEAMKSKK
ncbi:MAG: virulence RhuM family protein [Oscillospiraceae bacterium]|nr:virulence RhuM family protein [Oscillospiraceae bacterium]